MLGVLAICVNRWSNISQLTVVEWLRGLPKALRRIPDWAKVSTLAVSAELSATARSALVKAVTLGGSNDFANVCISRAAVGASPWELARESRAPAQSGYRRVASHPCDSARSTTRQTNSRVPFPPCKKSFALPLAIAPPVSHGRVPLREPARYTAP